MYSITENIYYSQLSSVAILLLPEPNCFTSYNTRKWLCFLSLCTIILRSPPASKVSTSNGQWSSQLFCAHCTVVIMTRFRSRFMMDLRLRVAHPCLSSVSNLIRVDTRIILRRSPTPTTSQFCRRINLTLPLRTSTVARRHNKFHYWRWIAVTVYNWGL
jgi:hypothetical protein